MSMFGKLKQIKDLRKQAKDIQGKLANIQGTGEAEHGKISLTIDGSHNIQDISLDESLLNPSSKKTLEQGIISAHEKASKQIQKIMMAQMRKGELEMPDLNLK